MSVDFTRQRKGVYAAARGRFSVYRSEDGKTWRAYDALRNEGPDDTGLVGTYRTLSDAQDALNRIWNAERQEIARVEMAQRDAERKVAEAKKAEELEARLSSTQNLRNAGVFAKVTITQDEALGLIQRLADHAKGSETVEIVIRSESAYPEPYNRLGIQIGWSGFDTAHAIVVDSAVEIYELVPSTTQTEEVSS